MGQAQRFQPFFALVEFPGVKFLGMFGFTVAAMAAIEAERHALLYDGLSDFARRKRVFFGSY